MPCDSISVVKVEFKAENYGILLKVVQAMGGQMQRNCQTGRATITVSGATITIKDGVAQTTSQNGAKIINDVRVAYGKEVVEQGLAWARAKGWVVQRTGGNQVTISKGK